MLILGDLNGRRWNKTLPITINMWDMLNRGDKTIDLFYGNIKDTCKSYKKPLLRTADDNVVNLVPGSGVQVSLPSCFGCNRGRDH